MKKLLGTLASVAVLSLAAGAQATSQQEEDINQGGSGSSSGSMGGSGSYGGSMGMNQQQVQGKVLKADNKSITIEHMGAALPLSVQSSTSFQGVKSVKDIKEGQQVRANFELKGTQNQLTSIEVLPSGSQGGTGSGSQGSDMGSGSGSGTEGSGGY